MCTPRHKTGRRCVSDSRGTRGIAVPKQVDLGPEDVKAVVLSCTRCPGEYGCEPQRPVRICRAFPFCRRSWERSHDWKWLGYFLELTKLAVAAKSDQTDILIKVWSQVDSPD